MDKLKMAHEAALAMIKNGTSASSAIWYAWQYADEMKAEADERSAAEKQREAEESEQFMNKILKTSNSVDLEWQPDWSLAPEWANWWAIDADGSAYFYSYEPSMTDGYDYWGAFNGQNGKGGIASDFGYKGDWRESLRKRP